MGYGAWSKEAFADYSRKHNRKLNTDGSLAGHHSNQELFTAKGLDPLLNPYGVTRECCDSDEHPGTLPVILALDVTGSMGNAAVKVAEKLNVIMTNLYRDIPDVQFMIMGIGDFAYDTAPLQVSQFEADIRIAEQLDKVWFEFGGGGNTFESYTAAWYFAARRTRLDAWKRGKKGLLITMGDEELNPYIPKTGWRTTFENVTGDVLQDDLETKDLYKEVTQKYELYHLNVRHRTGPDGAISLSWRQYLDKAHYLDVTLETIADEIVRIIRKEAAGQTGTEAGESFLRKISKGIAW